MCRYFCIANGLINEVEEIKIQRKVILQGFQCLGEKYMGQHRIINTRSILSVLAL